MESASWVCANCERPGGKLEKPREWKEYLVCGDCHAKLSAQVPVAPPAGLEPPKRRTSAGTAGDLLHGLSILGLVTCGLAYISAAVDADSSSTDTVFKQLVCQVRASGAAVGFVLSFLCIGLARAANVLHEQILRGKHNG